MVIYMHTGGWHRRKLCCSNKHQEDIHGETDGLWDEYIIVIQTKKKRKEKDGRRKKMAGFVGRTFAGSNVKSRAVDLKRKKNLNFQA